MRDLINAKMPEINAAVEQHQLDEYFQQALSLVVSGKAREAFDLKQESEALRDTYGRNTFGQSCLLARRLVEAGTRVVEVIWPKVANSDNHSWDHHADLSKRMKTQSAPMLDRGLSALITDLDDRGLLEDTLVVAVGEFGRSPERGVSTSGNGNSDDGRDHWPYCYTAVMAGAGIKRGYVHGKSDKTASSPVEAPLHPAEMLATIYHSLGSIPSRSCITISINHESSQSTSGDAAIWLIRRRRFLRACIIDAGMSRKGRHFSVSDRNAIIFLESTHLVRSRLRVQISVWTHSQPPKRRSPPSHPVMSGFNHLMIGLLNQTLQNIDAARTLLAKHLPSQIAEHLKLDTLTHVDTSFIDHNLRRRFADRLLSVEVSEAVIGNLETRTTMSMYWCWLITRVPTILKLWFRHWVTSFEFGKTL